MKSIEKISINMLGAVALLMAGSFYCVIYAEIEKSSDNIESISSEFAAVEGYSVKQDASEAFFRFGGVFYGCFFQKDVI